jgi:hypothetical protein
MSNEMSAVSRSRNAVFQRTLMHACDIQAVDDMLGNHHIRSSLPLKITDSGISTMLSATTSHFEPKETAELGGGVLVSEGGVAS